MLDEASIVSYLRSSLVLKSPDIETDVAFKFEDSDLWDIVKYVIPQHNPNHTELTLPDNEKMFAVLLARKEVYFRLATASAPFYPITAEGAELRKDYRFEHYMSLVRITQAEYGTSYAKFLEDTFVVQVGDVILASKHHTTRNYELSTAPTVVLEVVNTRETELDVAWSKFDATKGKFSCYTIYLSDSPIYDEFEDVISSSATKEAEFMDIHRTKYRVKSLEPDTTYYVLIRSQDLNGRCALHEVQVKTSNGA